MLTITQIVLGARDTWANNIPTILYTRGTFDVDRQSVGQRHSHSQYDYDDDEWMVDSPIGTELLFSATEP